MESKEPSTSRSTQFSAERDAGSSDQNSHSGRENGASFKQEIFKIILDKFLIGLLLVIAAFFSTIVIERFKGDVSLSGELNKIRAEKIGDAWEQLYRYEGVNTTLQKSIASFRQIDSLNDAAEQKKENWVPAREVGRSKGPVQVYDRKQALIDAMKSMDELSTSSRGLYKDVIDTANKNRFWLGKDNYEQIVAYAALLDEYRSRSLIELDGGVGSGKDNQTTLKELEDKIAKSSISIENIRSQLLVGGQ